ncbi:MAG: hypothetical protein ABIJ96_10280 [Elusimicrobiota bacterium]
MTDDEITEKIRRLFSLEPMPGPDDGFVRGVMAVIRKEEAAGIELPFRWWAPAFAFGLAAAIFVFSLPQPETAASAGIMLAAADTEPAGIDEMLGISLEEQ